LADLHGELHATRRSAAMTPDRDGSDPSGPLAATQGGFRRARVKDVPGRWAPKAVRRPAAHVAAPPELLTNRAHLAAVGEGERDTEKLAPRDPVVSASVHGGRRAGETVLGRGGEFGPCQDLVFLSLPFFVFHFHFLL
jgi:hypothetical protein